MNPALPRIIPFAVFIGFIALDGALAKVAPSLGMDPRWSYGVRTAAVAVLLVAFWRQYTELRSLAARASDWLLAVAIGIVVFVLWVNLDIGPLTFGRAAGYDPRTDGTIDLSGGPGSRLSPPCFRRTPSVPGISSGAVAKSL